MGRESSRMRIFASVVALLAMTIASPAQDDDSKSRGAGSGHWIDMSEIEIPVIYSSRLIRKRKLDVERMKPFTLLDRDGDEVLKAIKGKVDYFEWKHIKLVCQLPTVNLAVEMAPKTPEERKNWEFLEHEIADLKRIFPNARVGTLDGHKMGHLVMNRLMRFYLKFEKEMRFWDAVKGWNLKDYGMGPHLGQKAPFEIYVLKRNNYFKFEDKFVGRKSVAGQKHIVYAKDALVYLCPYEGPFPRFNNQLHHCFAQLLIWAYRHWSFDLPGWLHTGFGHFIERSITPRYNTFDFDEGGDANIQVSGWKWEKDVRKMVASRKYTPIAELKTKLQMSEFTGKEFQIAWSLVRYLAEMDKAKFRDFVDLISQKIDQDEALKRIYGWSFNVFEERWREHVLETYKTR